MTPCEKELTAKIESLERETHRLFRFETALLQVRDVFAASLPPNRGVADIISILEEAGFPLPTNQMSPDDEMSVSPDANIIPFPLPSRPRHEH